MMEILCFAKNFASQKTLLLQKTLLRKVAVKRHQTFNQRFLKGIRSKFATRVAFLKLCSFLRYVKQNNRCID